MRHVLLSAFLAAAPALGRAAEAPPPAASAKDRSAELASKVADYRRARQEERQAFRRRLRDEEEKLRAELGGSKSPEAQAARAKLKTGQKAARAAFEAEQKAKREAFLKENPEVAERWEKQHLRREEAKQRCAKDPDCRPKGRKETPN